MITAGVRRGEVCRVTRANMERESSGACVRLASAEDAAAVSKVLRESFEEYRALYTQGGFDATTPLSAEVLRRMEEGPIWVATFDGRVVGTVSVVPKGESLYIRGMGLVPAARGRKIGELLLKHAESYAKEHGFKRMFLSTTPFLARAIRLYERRGFERTDEGPDNLFGTPLFTMEKFIKQSS